MSSAGTLYVVATPIGNLDDLSPRALESLQCVARIACEDTRHTGKLLKHFGVTTPMTSCHEHNEAQRVPELLAMLESGADVALVSDAGTPLVSDPGFRLVRACRQEGIGVVPIPGPSAALAALSVSGLPSDRFLFVGFLPRQKAPRRRALEEVAGVAATLIFFVAPHRLAGTLEQAARVLGNRDALLGRELTKLHEETIAAPLEELAREVAGKPARGEYALVVAGADGPADQVTPIDASAYVAGLITSRGLSRSDAVRRAAKELGVSRRELYGRVVEE